MFTALSASARDITPAVRSSALPYGQAHWYLTAALLLLPVFVASALQMVHVMFLNPNMPPGLAPLRALIDLPPALTRLYQRIIPDAGFMAALHGGLFTAEALQDRPRPAPAGRQRAPTTWGPTQNANMWVYFTTTARPAVMSRSGYCWSL